MVVVNKVAEDAAIRERHGEVLHLHTVCPHTHSQSVCLKMVVSSGGVYHKHGIMWTEGAHLQAVEVTHSSDPVHQQGHLHAAVFVRRAGGSRSQTQLVVLMGSQQRQPLLGSQGSLQEANFLPQLIFIQNNIHL